MNALRLYLDSFFFMSGVCLCSLTLGLRFTVYDLAFPPYLDIAVVFVRALFF